MKKLVVITGASSGIGKASAIKFSKDGYPLLLLARRLEKLEELNLPNTLVKKVDIRDKDAIKQAILEAESIYGKTDLLINNAGIMLLGEVATQNPNEWKDMLETNVMGVLNGIHCVLEDMKNNQHGTIINVSSLAGRKIYDNHAIYCASKFGVHALSESIREEIAKYNVRMIVIAPGVVDTELLQQNTSKELIDNYNDWVDEHIGYKMSSDEVANSIYFAYIQPQTVCIREIVLAPTKQFK